MFWPRSTSLSPASPGVPDGRIEYELVMSRARFTRSRSTRSPALRLRGGPNCIVVAPVSRFSVTCWTSAFIVDHSEVRAASHVENPADQQRAGNFLLLQRHRAFELQNADRVVNEFRQVDGNRFGERSDLRIHISATRRIGRKTGIGTSAGFSCGAVPLRWTMVALHCTVMRWLLNDHPIRQLAGRPTRSSGPNPSPRVSAAVDRRIQQARWIEFPSMVKLAILLFASSGIAQRMS